MRINDTLIKIKPKIGVLLTLTGILVVVTGCYAHTDSNMHESWNNEKEARIICNHFNNIFKNNKAAFNLARAKVPNPLVQFFCIPDKGLVLPGSPESKNVKYPTPYVRERPNTK